MSGAAIDETPSCSRDNQTNAPQKILQRDVSNSSFVNEDPHSKLHRIATPLHPEERKRSKHQGISPVANKNLILLPSHQPVTFMMTLLFCGLLFLPMITLHALLAVSLSMSPVACFAGAGLRTELLNLYPLKFLPTLRTGLIQ